MANKLFTVCLFILVVELCERLAYYTFSGSQRNFLMRLGSSNSQSTAINAAFSVITYITPFIGGWLADARLGRFKTIFTFATIYCVGVALAATSAHPSINQKGLYLFALLCLVTLGSGGIKPNIANFGGDQYDLSVPDEIEQQQKFFSYFYLVISTGSGVAYGYMVTLATNGAEPGIPKEYGFFACFMIAAGSMFMAFFVFISGSRFYVKRPPTGDSLRGMVYYIWESAKRTTKGKISVVGWIATISFLATAVGAAFITDNQTSKKVAWLLLALALCSCVCLVTAHLDNSYVEDIEEHPMRLLTVSEAKATMDIIPTLLVSNVTYSVGYNVMNGPFQSESCQMNLNVGGSQINGAFFNVASSIVIVICVPLLENVIMPIVERKRGVKMSGSARIVTGMTMSIIALATAICLEYARRNADVLVDDDDSNCAPENIKMSDISGFLMFIPYACIGVAETFVIPFLYYFTYDQTPPRARSVSQAFNLLAMGGLSNGFTTVITLALSDYYTDDLNEGHLEYLYYVTAAVTVVGIPLTLYCQSKFVPKDYSHELVNEDIAKQSEGVFLEEGAMDGGMEKKQ